MLSLVASALLLATPANLVSTLAGAACGDHLALSPGSYGDAQVRKTCPAGNPLVITSADPANFASFRTLNIQGAGLAFDHLAIIYTPDAKTVDWSAALTVNGASDVSLAALRISGGPAIAGGLETDTTRPPSDCIIGRPCGYGVYFSHASRIALADSDISQFGRGVSISYLTDGQLVRNSVHDTRRTSILGAGLLRVTFDRNHLWNVRPWAWGQSYGDHGDFLALWIDGGQTFNSEGVVISHNLMEQGDGVAVLGSWLQDSAAVAWTFVGPIYEGNTILDGNLQGIMPRGVTGARITGNVLLQTSGDLKAAPSILLRGKTSGATVAGNVAWQVDDRSTGPNSLGPNQLVAPGVQPGWVLDLARRGAGAMIPAPSFP